VRRALLASAALHVLLGVGGFLLALRGPSRPDLPPIYQVNLVQAAELPPRRTPPEPEPVVEEPPEEPEAVEKVPEPEADPPKPEPKDEQPEAVERGPSLPVTLEGQPFEFPWYLEALVRKVERNWRPGEGTLKTTIYFRIDRAGRVSDVEVADPSGSFLFDRAARRAVEASDPMPPLPAEYSGDFLGVYFDFDAGVRPSG